MADDLELLCLLIITREIKKREASTPGAGFYHDSSPKSAKHGFLTQRPQAISLSFVALTTSLSECRQTHKGLLKGKKSGEGCQRFS